MWSRRTRLSIPRPSVGSAGQFCTGRTPHRLVSTAIRWCAMALDLLLKTLERRDALTEEERTVVREFAVTEAVFKPAQVIVDEEDRPGASLLLSSGFAARFQLLETGDRQLCAFHVPGDFVDLHSFTLKQMDHGVLALAETRVLQVPHETLRKVTENHPHLGRLLWLLTNIDAAMHRKWIASLGQRHGPDRLAHLICELFLRLEAVNQAEGHAFDFPITQADLADALGYSIVHTNRMVQQLRREGLIKWEGHRVEILNWPALVRRGKFDPQYLYLRPEPR